MGSLKTVIKKILMLIRVKETVFSLPLAYVGVLVASHDFPPFKIWFWVGIALFSARALGMSLNRLIDAEIDLKNPRTKDRMIPAGNVSKLFVKVASILFAILFLFSCFLLNELCLRISPIILILLCTYSYFKRFSASSHLYLGITEGFAPIGGAIAASGNFDIRILFLSVFVTFWIAGLDIIYSCQDMTHDQKVGLKSIPARYGLTKALLISKVFHCLAVLSLVLLGFYLMGNFYYWIGLVVVSLLFVWQHSLVSPQNLEKLQIAFFTANKYISISLFLTFLIFQYSRSLSV